MWQTICYVPHELYGVPVFGCGWALLAWCVFAAIVLGDSFRRRGFDRETRGLLPFLLLVAVAIAYILPRLEETVVAGDGTHLVVGLPIRGYGTMMLCGVTAAVALALRRGRRWGLDSDLIYGLAMWICIGGIVGGRLFYVIQYWDQYRAEYTRELIGNVVNIARGGLVVYGAFFGALTAFAAFAARKKLPALVLADLIAPSMLLGLALGRLGCLLNGCCYGGICTLPWAVTFPPESPPYMNQLSRGWRYGMLVTTDEEERTVVTYVQPDGAAETAGLRVGDVITTLNGVRLDSSVAESASAAAAATTAWESFGSGLAVTTSDGKVREVRAALPMRSAPVHPTQVYSALNAALLCLLLLAYAPFQRRDGELFALLLTLYPVTRFVLEIIRRDEPAIWNTGLTISQTVSIGVLAVALGLWLYVLRQPPRGDRHKIPEKSASRQIAAADTQK